MSNNRKLLYIDMNNLYGQAQAQALPLKGKNI